MSQPIEAELSGIELAAFDVADIDLPRTRDVSGGPSAVVNGGAIVAFEANISPQDREDVLYSLQFAQRAAAAKFDRMEQAQAWYGEYVRVLEVTGWVVKGFAPVKQTVTSESVQVAKAALEILVQAAAGGAALAVLGAAIKALEGMAEDDGFITLFERIATDGALANFQMGEVRGDASGTLSMQTGAFQFKAKERQRKFLFFKWNSKAVEIFADTQTAVFNRDHYAKNARKMVREKLGQDAQKAIGEISLGTFG